MANAPISYERCKIRPTATEKTSQWVLLHTGKHYLLPIVARQQRVVPTFNDDGTLTLEVEQKDPELAPLLDSFFELVATFNKVEKSIMFATEEVYFNFFRLVQKLVLTNYDFTNTDLGELLTVNNDQLRILFEAFLKHLLRQ